MLGQSVEVKVTISREELEKLLGPTAQAADADVRPQMDILIVVRPRLNCRIIAFDREFVRPPALGQPVELIFEVQGEREGVGEVFVEARQGARRLLTIVLQPHFVAAAAPLRATAVVDTRTSEPPLVQVRIFEEPLGAGQFRLHFIVQCRELNLNLSHRSEPVRRSRESFVEDLYKRLEDSWTSDGSEYQRFVARLRDLGAELYVQLVPEPIRRELWRHRNVIGSIEAISEEPFIPWEIAHLVEPDHPVATDRTWFLGELGLIRWLDNLDWPPATLRLRAGRVWYVIPDYPVPQWKLTGAQAERQVLTGLFGAQPAPVDSLSLVNLLRHSSEVDLLHFACHGTANNAAIWNAGLMLEGRVVNGDYHPDPLEVSQVRHNSCLRHADGTQPVVFVNACQVGRRGYMLAGTGGFADAFLRCGAGVFVGTLWSVGDSPALSFASVFYQHLKAGDTLIQASCSARASAREHEATWLSYTVYGHPYARLDISGELI